MQTPEPPQPGAPILPLVRLRRDAKAITVIPGDGSDLDPFRLPRVDQSLIDWLSSGMEQILRGDRRCVAVLLLLDLALRKWSYVIPRQSAGGDAACWQLRRASGAHLPPTSRIAGSLQTRVLAPGEAAADAVPPVDGLHIVQIFNDDMLTMWCFLRVEQDVVHVNPPDVIEPDLMRLVAQIRSRAEFI